MNDLNFLSIFFFFVKATFFLSSLILLFIPSYLPSALPFFLPSLPPLQTICNYYPSQSGVNVRCMHLHFLSGRPQKIYMGVYGKERMQCTSPDFYWPFLCMVLKQCFDLINNNSAEAKDGVLLSFDICLWFAVGFMTSLHSFMLEFTDSDSCCRGNIENIFFSLATMCFLIVASFSSVLSLALISFISVTICLGAWYYMLWTGPTVLEGLGWCCLLLCIMKIVVLAWGRWAGFCIEMQNICWFPATYSSPRMRLS